MKNNLFIILAIGLLLLLVSILFANIYLLGMVGITVISAMIKLYIINLKKVN